MNSDVLDPPRRAAPPTRAPVGVLVVGCGNLLRSDDGVGPAIVSRLAAAIGDDLFCRCRTPQQLTADLADDLAEAQRAIFIDACTDLKPGRIQVRRIQPAPVVAHSLSHHLTPQALLALCRSLHGAVPHAWTVAIGPANLRVGDRLSPPVCVAAARVAAIIRHRIKYWSHISASHASKGNLP